MYQKWKPIYKYSKCQKQQNKASTRYFPKSRIIKMQKAKIVSEKKNADLFSYSTKAVLLLRHGTAWLSRSPGENEQLLVSCQTPPPHCRRSCSLCHVAGVTSLGRRSGMKCHSYFHNRKLFLIVSLQTVLDKMFRACSEPV